MFGQDNSPAPQGTGTHLYVYTIHEVRSAPLLLLAPTQVDTQVAEQGSYGNGVENILVKEDPSLPLFVAIV